MDSIIQDGKVYFLEFVKNLLDIVSQSIQTINVIQLWFSLLATYCNLTNSGSASGNAKPTACIHNINKRYY
jgi:hypothetical protein